MASDAAEVCGGVSDQLEHGGAGAGGANQGERPSLVLDRKQHEGVRLSGSAEPFWNERADTGIVWILDHHVFAADEGHGEDVAVGGSENETIARILPHRSLARGWMEETGAAVHEENDAALEAECVLEHVDGQLEDLDKIRPCFPDQNGELIGAGL
jgi:hypothetical protein